MPHIIADLDTDRLSALDDDSQDFVIASHVLEHLANPLAMLGEIHRVLRIWGVALVLLPDRRRTLDRARRPTPLQHLVAEYEADVTTVSDGHVEDFLRGVGEWQDDWSADARMKVIERQRQRSIHVHCWNQDEFSEICSTSSRPDVSRGISSMRSSSRTSSTASSSGTCFRSCPPTAKRRWSAPIREVLERLRAVIDRPATPGKRPNGSLGADTVCGASPRQPRRTAAQQPSPSWTGHGGAAAIAVRTRRSHPLPPRWPAPGLRGRHARVIHTAPGSSGRRPRCTALCRRTHARRGPPRPSPLHRLRTRASRWRGRVRVSGPPNLRA